MCWRLLVLCLCVLGLLGVPLAAQAQPVLVLDDFNSGTMRLNVFGDPLWHNYEPCTLQGAQCVGSTTIDSTQHKDGNYSLRDRMTSGRAYIYFAPQDNADWQFTRAYILGGTWQLNTYNRMRLWVKPPPETIARTNGTTNFNIGTFVRCSTCSAYETGGGHFYHFMNFPYTGEWHQILWDMHPTSSRTGGPCYGPNGHNDDCGLRDHPSGESGFNYFDLLTGWYLDWYGNDPSQMTPGAYPADYYVDGFEFYYEPNAENETQVYSVNGVYVPASNRLYLNWNRNKYDNFILHEVRYAFSDIHASGWNAATPAPGGTITPPGWAGYNDMFYDTTAIDVSGHSTVYMAIKPQNSALFKQIAIPVTAGAPPPLPPTTLRILR